MISRTGIAIALMGAAGLALAVSPAAEAQQARRVSLGQAIDIAVGNNRDIAQAEASLRAAGGQVREAWASVFPEIRATASYQRNFQVQEVFLPRVFVDPTASPDELFAARFGADNQWQAGLTFSQTLFSAAAFIGVGAAGKFRALQNELVRGVAQNVVTSVRLSYFDVLLTREQVRLTAQSVARVTQTLEETQALNRAGLASNYDVLRLEVQLGNLEPNLRRARDGVAAASRTLAVVMGLDADTPLDVEGNLHEMVIDDVLANSAENRAILILAGTQPSEASGVLEAFATAMEARPDIRQARLNIELEQARYAVERADFFPKVTLFSNYSVQAQQNGGLSFFGRNNIGGDPTRNERTTSLNGGIRIELPIFTGLSRTARMSQAKANTERNQSLLALTEQRAANQIHTLLASVDETRQRVESQSNAVAQAQRGFEIASAEYRAGVGSQLQITDAEVALRQSEFNYAQAVYDYLTARANLDAARGTVPDRSSDLIPLQTN